MTAIVTVTLNPALDVSSHTRQVLPTHKLRCDGVNRFAGGGGVNVARVLHRLGAPVSALAPLGGTTGDLLAQLLQQEGVDLIRVPITGPTRESFTVTETSSWQEYRFVLPGPVLSHAQWQACLDAVALRQPAPQWLVASGSLPPGAPTDFYAQLAQYCRQRGMRMLLDTSGPALEAALDVGVYLVKPSLGEMRQSSGLPLQNVSDIYRLAKAWVDAGRAQVVVVSMGEQGALLVSQDIAVMAPALAVPVVSAVGAGDSLVAGLVFGLWQSNSLVDALRWGLACATAAVQSRNLAELDTQTVAAFRTQVLTQVLADELPATS